MAVGISVANSILLVSFAEQARREHQDVEAATRTGATGRVRAILMTATAMICGMIPAGDRLRRGRAPICAPGPRGDWRSHFLHTDYPAGASCVLRAAAKESEPHVELSQP